MFIKDAKTWFQKLFRSPKVDYIPITFKTVTKIPINGPVNRVNIYPSIKDIPNISFEMNHHNENGLYMTLTNNKAINIQLRGELCTVTTTPNHQTMEILWVDDKQFQNDTTIHITMVSKDGKRLSWTNYRVRHS